MIRVHHLNNSRSQRVLWLLEELALPYEIVQYQRDSKTMLAPESLKRIHPLGKAPVIEQERELATQGAGAWWSVCVRLKWPAENLGDLHDYGRRRYLEKQRTKARLTPQR